MSSLVILGNTAPTDTHRDPKTDEVLRSKLGRNRAQTMFMVRHGNPFEGFAEILHAWSNFHSYDAPAWVAPVMGTHAGVLADGLINHFSVDETARETVKSQRELMRRQGMSNDDMPEIPKLHVVKLGRPDDWDDEDLGSITGPVALKTNLGNDQQSRQMGGDVYPVVGTSSAISATTLTTNQNYAVNSLAGHWVQTGGSYGVIISNTVGPNSVLTVDKWYDPAAPGGAALATPATGAYVVLPGGAPFTWMGITTDATAPSATDVVLATELALSGLTRALTTYGHTTSAASFTESKQFTNPDATARTINKAGLYYSATGSTMGFESAVPSPPVLASSSDSTTITETITL